ncbi:MAG: hypothetical protein ACI8W8_002579 [Rhodothermales bacterium]|jgi:hypothetical protein
MKRLALFLLIALTCSGRNARTGLIVLGTEPLPVPEGVREIPLPGADFEADDWPERIAAFPKREVVNGDEAPDGARYGRIAMRKGARVAIRGMTGIPGEPHVFSLWVNTPAASSASIAPNGPPSAPRSYVPLAPGLPSTGGKWRHLSYYFVLPAQAKTCDFVIEVEDDSTPDATLSFDAPQLRTASWRELAIAYDGEHANYPHCDNRHSADAGQNLSLAVSKWQGKAGLSRKPFVIWALGKPLGNGLPLLLAIRQNFPDAPPLIYRTLASPGTSWSTAAGWVQQFVGAEQPDLILSSTGGSPEGLEALLTQIRRHSTADVMIGSQLGAESSSESAQREICRKHKAQFVEISREIAAYLTRHKLEPSALLNESGQPNAHGLLRSWDAFCRRIAPASESSSPEIRELRIPFGDVRKADSGRRIHVPFTGNRIDIIGRKSAGGGKAIVYIDGHFAHKAPAWRSSFIRADAGDPALCAVTLSSKLQAQTWSIAMTSNTGKFRLSGSITGADGAGNARRPFHSDSGQIHIEPASWRSAVGKTGDRLSFSVSHAASRVIDFSGTGAFSQTIVQQLPNGPHTLDLVLQGEADIEAFYIFMPPLK